MSHSFPRIWVHLVFGTKNRQLFITPDIESKIYRFIKSQMIDKGCFVKSINGMPDHIHILTLLNQNISLADLVKQIKGSSSHWVNQHNIYSQKFAWQTGYGAFSVSESQISKVDAYITNQKAQHQTKTFMDEYEGLLKLHNIDLRSG